MVNPEIITSLKNALDHGESLDEAKQVLMNSGYNPTEIEEASKFIGGVEVGVPQIKPGEELTMPRKSGLLGRFTKYKKPQPATIAMSNPPKQMPHSQAPPKQPIQPSTPSRPPPPSVSTNQIQRLVQQTPQPKVPPQPQPTQAKVPTQVQSQPIEIQTTPQPSAQPTTPTESTQSEIKPSEFPKPEDGGLVKEIGKIKPAGPSHGKEIILFVILLLLITILVLSFIFKDKIIGLFSFFLSLI